MNCYYTVLFALSIVLIHPWGDSRSEIWTQPQVAVLGLIVFSNFWNLAIDFWQNDYQVLENPTRFVAVVPRSRTFFDF